MIEWFGGRVCKYRDRESMCKKSVSKKKINILACPVTFMYEIMAYVLSSSAFENPLLDLTNG